MKTSGVNLHTLCRHAKVPASCETIKLLFCKIHHILASENELHLYEVIRDLWLLQMYSLSYARVHVHMHMHVYDFNWPEAPRLVILPYLFHAV